MEPTAPNRRLAAILRADVVGYSRMMGEDEEATVATLRSRRAVFTSYIDRYRKAGLDIPDEPEDDGFRKEPASGE